MNRIGCVIPLNSSKYGFTSFFDDIQTPTLLLDEIRVKRNISRMVGKAQASSVALRPHFKTHQSGGIGEWFRSFGVNGITVSSVAMAEYFADFGWTDITIAFPLNIRELERLKPLSRRVQINLLVDNLESVAQLAEKVTTHHRIFVKIDTGYHRTGIEWHETETIAVLVNQIAAVPTLTFAGILTHAGHAYHYPGIAAINRTLEETVFRMNAVRITLNEKGIAPCPISIGNSPCCTVADRFRDVDEIRPGNFVFSDLMQWRLGAVAETDLALALLCPVVGVYPSRGEAVIMGGAVHFGREFLAGEADDVVFGMGFTLSPTGFQGLDPSIRLTGLSQEHGTLQLSPDLLSRIRIGDLLSLAPVHSCLTADLYDRYMTFSGECIPRINSVSQRSCQDSRT